MVSLVKILCVVLLGVVASSSAALVRNRPAYSPPSRPYGQAPVRATVEPKMVEPEMDEFEDVEAEPVYKSAVRTPERPPIRVSYAKQPEKESYVSGYDSSTRRDNEKVADEQNRSAQYSFGSAVEDSISDLSHVRQETRDGLKTEGSYSYSDGFYKYTVKYVADENGYRVLENDKELIGDGSGPLVDTVNGKADVLTSNQGVEMAYSVSARELDSFSKRKTQSLRKIDEDDF